MSKKLNPVSDASKVKSNPFTPMRRFLKLKLLKPIEALRKPVGNQSHAADKPEHFLKQKFSRWKDFPLPGSSSFAAATAARKATSVKDPTHHQVTPQAALQLYDRVFDAIVITTLLSCPFRRHEDLLMMSRSQLVQVAVMFNSRLPLSTQIELADSIPEAHIRHTIEMLVGIIPEMPDAPKAIKFQRFEMTDVSDALPSPPTSPLSKQVSRRQEMALPVMSTPPRLLERLDEEDENDVYTMNRPHKKKRKMSKFMASILSRRW